LPRVGPTGCKTVGFAFDDLNSSSAATSGNGLPAA
jgi:hypothetical protein